MEQEIVNRVSNSKLLVFDLEELYTPGERLLFDIKPWLFQELILREKEYRDYIKNHDWSQYTNKLIAITCTAEAIIPTWAYMLLSSALQPVAGMVVFGSLDDLESIIYQKTLEKVDWEKYRDAKVVIKGCSKVNVPISAYVEATNKLRALASSVMFGEPCSTVPIFKKKM